MFIVFIRNFTSGDEDGIALDAFVIVLKGFVLEDRHFVVMPGGGSSEGDGSASTNGGCGVSMPVAVEVGSLQPFQVKGDPHSISQRWRKWKRAFELYVLGK